MLDEAIIRRAITIADAEPRSMTALAQAVGIPIRTLNHIWNKRFGTSPGRYLRERRMARARTALVAKRATVTDIATQYGFYELGRFAAIYRQRYGEVPSATLRSA